VQYASMTSFGSTLTHSQCDAVLSPVVIFAVFDVQVLKCCR